MNELDGRGIYKFETYAPYYLCSFACHHFNLMNHRREIYWESSDIPNLRLHLIFVAPPGGFKSFFLRTMGGARQGIFANTSTDILHMNSITEAGLIGSINNEGEEIQGDAHTHAEGILSIDEFSAITASMSSTFNNQLSAQLLNLLDHGHVHKRLAGGTLNYISNATMWGGVQPAHFDLSSGLGRRICFLFHIPTPEENKVILTMQHQNKNASLDYMGIESLREDIILFREQLNFIERITFDDSILEWKLKYNIPIGESSLYDRIILGYNLLNYPIEKEMNLIINEELLSLLMNEMEWRTAIKLGVEYTQIKSIIEVNGIKNDECIELNRDTLISFGTAMGLNARQINKTLTLMKELGMLEYGRKFIRLY